MGDFRLSIPQTDDDASRTLSVLVIVIVPGLASAYLRRFRRVAVRYIVSAHMACITGHRIFRDPICDHLAVLILVQVLETPVPAVRFCHYLVSYFFSIRKQMDRNALRTFPIPVVAVVPGLASAYACFSRRVAVYHVVTVVRGGVIRYRILGDRVCDLFSIFVLLQIRETPSPAVRFHHYPVIYFFSIRKQTDRNACRTFSVLVVVVVPGFASVYPRRFRRMRICYVVSVYFACITGYRIFRDRICDLFSAFILRQICETPTPVSGRIRRYRLFCYLRFSVPQPDNNAFRTLPVLIVVIFPGFASVYPRCFRRVAVRQRRYASLLIRIAQAVTFRQAALRPGINVLFSSGILIQFVDRLHPAVRFAQFHGPDRTSVLLQHHLDACRTFPVLIVCIVPDFLHRRAYLLQRICDIDFTGSADRHFNRLAVSSYQIAEAAAVFNRGSIPIRSLRYRILPGLHIKQFQCHIRIVESHFYCLNFIRKGFTPQIIVLSVRILYRKIEAFVLIRGCADRTLIDHEGSLVSKHIPELSLF